MKVSRRRRRLRQYINEQRKMAKRRPVLNLGQERDLLARVAAGDVQAGQLLVLHNLRYVLWVASRHANLVRTEDEFDDMVQEGCLGLAEAIAGYKPHDASFIAYAKYDIRKNIYRYLQQAHQVIFVPSDIHKALRRWARGEAVNVSVACMRAGRRALRIHLCDAYDFDRLPAAGDLLEETIAAITYQERGERLYDALEDLQPRRAAVLVMRFGLGDSPMMTLKQAGKALGVCGERVRGLERQAIIGLETMLKRRRGWAHFFFD